ncbi:MAG: hypothetical protein Q8R33_21830 [Burkholderiales bacterium]|nr:hypothetical protein [Burkholderiales bacterium]
MKSIRWQFWPKYMPKQMKPQQLSTFTLTAETPTGAAVRCAALPTLTTIVIAIASTLVLTLAG